MTFQTFTSNVPRHIWLLIAGHGSWKRLRDLGQWAFAEKAAGRTQEIQAGDIGIVYLTRDGGDSSLAGVVRFGEGMHKVSPRSFFDIEYPLRVPIEVVHVPAEPLPFRPLIQRLRFIQNKQNWGLYFQGQAARILSEEDATILLQSLGVEV